MGMVECWNGEMDLFLVCMIGGSVFSLPVVFLKFTLCYGDITRNCISHLNNYFHQILNR